MGKPEQYKNISQLPPPNSQLPTVLKRCSTCGSPLVIFPVKKGETAARSREVSSRIMRDKTRQGKPLFPHFSLPTPNSHLLTPISPKCHYPESLVPS